MKGRPAVVIFSPHRNMAPAFLSEGSAGYRDLCKRFDIIFYPIDFSQPPDTLVDRIAADIRQRQLPVSGIVPLMDKEGVVASALSSVLGIAAPPPVSIFRSQHKAVFARIAASLNPWQPPTLLVYPTTPRETLATMSYPAFLRPMRGSLSRNCHLVQTPEDVQAVLAHALWIHTGEMDWFDGFFHQFAPDDYIPLQGGFLLQPYIDEPQYTVDGFVHKGKVSVLGYTKSIYSDDRKSFLRFDYPGDIPAGVHHAMGDVLQRMAMDMAYDNGGFNVEFFLRGGKDIIFIEWNTRISRQFIPLLYQEYACSPLEMMMQLACGKFPTLTKRPVARKASSFPLRLSTDRLVVATPTQEHLRRLEQEKNIIQITSWIQPGKRLSDYDQDAYSFRYGIVDIAGETQQEIQQTLEDIQPRLGFVLEPVA